MSRYYRRREPGKKENLQAGLMAAGLAAAAAAVSFYFVRLFLSREPLVELPREADGEGDGLEEGGK